MSNLSINSSGEVRLCCGGKGCPVLIKDDQRVKIKDDFGNEIDISIDEAKLIAEAVDLEKE
jgi:hypothetical protein